MLLIRIYAAIYKYSCVSINCNLVTKSFRQSMKENKYSEDDEKYIQYQVRNSTKFQYRLQCTHVNCFPFIVRTSCSSVKPSGLSHTIGYTNRLLMKKILNTE